VTRLALVGVLCLLTWYQFPDSRAIVLDAAAPVVRPVVRPVVNTFMAWGTLDEMERVGRNVVTHERLTGEIPEGEGAWQAWLEERYPARDIGFDTWGAPYQLLVWPDSVGILSYGPDGIPGTADDLQVATPRG